MITPQHIATVIIIVVIIILLWEAVTAPIKDDDNHIL